MGRHSSFGSRLGAYRNRQIRLAIGRDNRRRKPQSIASQPENTDGAIIAMLFLLVAVIICAISGIAH